MNTFLRIRNCLGVNGLAGIDKLLSFMIVGEHYVVQKELKSILRSDKQNLKNESHHFGMLNKVVKDIDKIYDGAKKRLKPKLESIVTSLEKIGLYTILREMTLRELNLSSKSDSQKVFLLLENMNEAITNEVQKGRYDNLQKEEIYAEATFLSQIADLSVRMGFADPINKIYFRPNSIEMVP